MFSRRSAAVLPTLLALALGTAVPAHADYIYNNFAPTNPSFNTGTGYSIINNYPVGPPTVTLADAFTVGATSYTLDSISVAMSSAVGPSAFTLNLVADNAGLPGSKVLESFTGITANGSYGTSFTPDTVTSSGHLVLDANTTYWVVASLDTPGYVLDAWMTNNTGAQGFASNLGSGWGYDSTDATLAMSVTGTALPVPEPRFYQMGLLLAMGGYAGLRLRGKRAASTQTPE